MEQQRTEPIIYNLNYQINGKPTDCGIRRVSKKDETYYTVCANIDGQFREFKMHFDTNIGHFSFDSDDIPEELKTVENDISDAIQRQDQ